MDPFLTNQKGTNRLEFLFRKGIGLVPTLKIGFSASPFGNPSAEVRLEAQTFSRDRYPNDIFCSHSLEGLAAGRCNSHRPVILFVDVSVLLYQF